MWVLQSQHTTYLEPKVKVVMLNIKSCLLSGSGNIIPGSEGEEDGD